MNCIEHIKNEKSDRIGIDWKMLRKSLSYKFDKQWDCRLSTEGRNQCICSIEVLGLVGRVRYMWSTLKNCMFGTENDKLSRLDMCMSR